MHCRIEDRGSVFGLVWHGISITVLAVGVQLSWGPPLLTYAGDIKNDAGDITSVNCCSTSTLQFNAAYPKGGPNIANIDLFIFHNIDAISDYVYHGPISWWCGQNETLWNWPGWIPLNRWEGAEFWIIKCYEREGTRIHSHVFIYVWLMCTVCMCVCMRACVCMQMKAGALFHPPGKAICSVSDRWSALMFYLKARVTFLISAAN